MTIRTVIPPCLRRVAKHVKDPFRLLIAALRCEAELNKASALEAKEAAAAAAYAAAAAAAYAAAAAAAAADAYADADAEKILVEYAENVVQILIEMKAPGVQWL
jgi:hypothetical protein